ncbi:MAG: PD-(D/E)XK nuclease family transposase [Fibrobacteraceae bacterium]|nr:PD-(D/E)XK nuclease family transposase [Fibrobacteraceae bacterium]
MSTQNTDKINLGNQATNNGVSNRKIPEILKGSYYLNATYEPAFLAFFDSKDTLRAFLNCILRLPEGRRIKDLSYDFITPIHFRTPEQKSIILDIHVKTEDGRSIDIEMQRAKHYCFVDRVLLYSAFHAIKAKQDYDASIDFKNLDELEQAKHRYDLPESVSLWICNFHPTENFQGYRDEWALYSKNALDKGDKSTVSEKIRYIVVDLVNVAMVFESIQSTEEKWLYVLRSAHRASSEIEVDDNDIASALNRIRTDSADDELLAKQAKDMVTQDEIDCRIAEGILDARELGKEIGKKLGKEIGIEEGKEIGKKLGKEIGIKEGKEIGKKLGLELGKEIGIEEGREKGLAEGMEQGLAEGRAEGLAQGRAEGSKEKAWEIAREMLLDGDSMERVARLAKLSEAEVLEIKQRLS